MKTVVTRQESRGREVDEWRSGGQLTIGRCSRLLRFRNNHNKVALRWCETFPRIVNKLYHVPLQDHHPYHLCLLSHSFNIPHVLVPPDQKVASRVAILPAEHDGDEKDYSQSWDHEATPTISRVESFVTGEPTSLALV